jgi:hypothetical protein
MTVALAKLPSGEANVALAREYHAALELRLTAQDFAALHRAFPPPAEATPLAML